LNNFKNKKKKDFIQKFVIPEAMKRIKARIKIVSTSIIRPFDPEKSKCDDRDPDGKNPALKITSDYHTRELEADYLLYVGVVQNEFNWIARASFCVQGIFLF
jgi:hypothetical protein